MQELLEVAGLFENGAAERSQSGEMDAYWPAQGWGRPLHIFHAHKP